MNKFFGITKRLYYALCGFICFGLLTKAIEQNISFEDKIENLQAAILVFPLAFIIHKIISWIIGD